MAVEWVDKVRLRALLRECLRTDADFEAFCLDHFAEVQKRFGGRMERVEKENLLLLHARSLEEILSALGRRFPDKADWSAMRIQEEVSERTRATAVSRVRRLRIGLVVLGGVAVLLPMGVGLWHAVKPSVADCGGLLLDDVFVVKQQMPSGGILLSLDARLRHGGQAHGAVDVTRAILLVVDKQAERAPYEISANYDLLVSGDNSEAAVAQRLTTGEMDRIVLRLGFTQETAAYQYTAKLRFRYNGSCMVESAPLVLARESARWPGAIPASGLRRGK
ncbi:MAG TPA: hypothetical protein PKE31_01445 [Pseudomonadota bacterium]|nr:hypothetical protein [Pseudomonadota bacterium]